MNGKTRKKIIFSLLLVAIYIGFKYYCYQVYGPEAFHDLSDVKITGNMNIDHIELKEDEYYAFDNIKVKNIFDGYERNNLDNDTFLRMVRKVDDKVISAIFIGSDEQFIDTLKNSKEYKGIFNKIAEKENINDDVDLLKYMEKHNDDKVTFFMPLKRQKQIYTINEFKMTMLPSIDEVKLVDGYYKGYMFISESQIYSVVIIKNNKQNFFTFIGDYTYEYINNFMNSVVIE